MLYDGGNDRLSCFNTFKGKLLPQTEPRRNHRIKQSDLRTRSLLVRRLHKHVSVLINRKLHWQRAASGARKR